ncbi:MAG: hypothetical protein H6736_20705 [Alphaproteobacteria bacterium]|nr:hypothetical protein [Alphaproteobacteria bacterium]
MRPLVSRVEPRAARYLELLVEFGHLESREVEQVVLAACEGWQTDQPVPLQAVQRVAATMLVREDAPMDGSGDILSSDWPLLFY